MHAAGCCAALPSGGNNCDRDQLQFWRNKATAVDWARYEFCPIGVLHRVCGHRCPKMLKRDRMRRRDFIALAGFAAAGPLAAGVAAAAETYPSRPITVIVPFGPGSGTDVIARIIGQHL